MKKSEIREAAFVALRTFMAGEKEKALEILREVFQLHITYRTILGKYIPTTAFKSAYGTPLHIQFTIAESLQKNTNEDLLKFLKFLWDTCGREERNVVALALKGFKQKAQELLPLIREYLAECGNWETCDNLAGCSLAELALATDDYNLTFFYEWTQDSNKWVRRGVCAAIAEMIKKVDQPDMLLAILSTVLEDDDYHVKKGAAWALREISRRYPDNVVIFLEKWIGTPNRNTRWIIRNGIKTLPAGLQEEIKVKINASNRSIKKN